MHTDVAHSQVVNEESHSESSTPNAPMHTDVAHSQVVNEESHSESSTPNAPMHTDVAQSQDANEESHSESSGTSDLMVSQECTSNSTCCIFCDKVRKMFKSRIKHLHFSSNNSIARHIISEAQKANNNEIIDKVNDHLSSKRAIAYHLQCRQNFAYECSRAEPKEKGKYHNERECHIIAYDQVCDYVNNVVLEEKKSTLLKTLHTMYTERLAEEFEKRLHDTPKAFFPHYLEQKLRQTYNKKISVLVEKNNTIIAPSGVHCIPDDVYEEMLMYEAVRNAALILRKSIMKMKSKKLPNNVTVDNLIQGECDIPDILSFFYTSLLCGVRKKRQNSSNKQRLIQSFTQDCVYGVTNGKVKTSKHITLAMSLKSLTSSRKVLEIINRYGHCCSYTATEELETEATYAASLRSQICPENIIRKPNLRTGLAFNNFDRYVDTLGGKDTLHDTVGIIFQNEVQVIDDNSVMQNEDDSRRKGRRRTFDAVTPQLEPVQKKRKVEQVLHPITTESNEESTSKRQKIIDIAWVISHAIGIPNTPMWVGFNNLTYIDESIKQKVAYMTTINLSPTNHEVVKETMLQAKRVAVECEETYMQVTYDLAIAKVALNIQSMESPNFSNLFIHLGGFHVMMAYFKAVGKFIDNCGLPNILIDSDILAGGSMNGFITGKHFNRCKRIHPIAALALSILHFNNFVTENNIVMTGEIKEYLTNYAKNKQSYGEIDCPLLQDIIERYEEYKKETLIGEHGKTAQFYMNYITLIEYYLLFNASIRTGNFALFKDILPRITNLFFSLNQPNYARWLVKYHYNLCQVDETHPGLREEFEQGSFGIKRTDKSFSRQPVDLTLEQTINADAANKLQGILHFTNSLAARQRWCKSHSIRSSIISHVLQVTGLKKHEDVTSDLEKSRMTKNTKHLQSLMERISCNMNPFSSSIEKQELFNISTGRAAPIQISNFLLNIENTGDDLRRKFIEECSEDTNRFEKPIKRTTMLTFANTLKKQKVVINKKVQEIRMQRDLFGRLLAIALDEKIDIEKVLTFPLTPVPLSLCHLDGTICKTDKSVLLKTLENKIESAEPNHLHVIVIDGFFFLYLLKDIPLTFGNISKQILQAVAKQNAKTIAIIFDRYKSPSIKDIEHSRRGTVGDLDYVITGREQNRPRDFVKELRNLKFKEALVKFLINDWGTDEMAPYIGIKTIYVNFDDCYKFEVVDNKVRKTIDETFSCPSHDEADTKIVYHVCNITTTDKINVCIKCSDTDILVILLANLKNVNNLCNVWMEVGVGNNKRHIDVSKLYLELEEPLCAALPGVHALTGCDYNPAFFKKGKKRPFSIVEASDEFQRAFAELSDINTYDFTLVFDTIQKFVCTLYGLKKLSSVNEARLAVFTKTYTFKNTDDLFKIKSKNVDASNLPPCEAELKRHVQRAAYISNIWKNASQPILTQMSPTENGWRDVEGTYDFEWFEGDQCPVLVRDVVLQPDRNEDSESESESRADNEDSETDSSSTEESDSDSE